MKRKGFTLIELLVVVTIIAILSAIVLQTVGGLLDMARTAKTRAVLWRLRVQNEHKAQAVDRLIKRGGYMNSCVESFWLHKNYPNLTKNQHDVLVRKLILGHFFPQDASELWDTKLYPVGTTIDDVILRIPVGNWTPDDDVQLMDGWGNPIVFMRWPTQLFMAHSEFLQYARDPDDPLCEMGTVMTAGIQFDATLPIVMHDPCKTHVMVFVSPGPDGKLGFSMPLGAVTSEEELSDNLWSFQR